MKIKWTIYKELELIPNSVLEPQVTQSKLPFWLGEIGRTLSVALRRRPTPYIWQSSGSKKKSQWYVYDPATGRTTTLESDAEVFRWLEHLSAR